MKYANWIHYALIEFADPALYVSLVTAYQAFSRDPSPARLHRLQTQLGLMAASAGKMIQPPLEQMAYGANAFTGYRDLHNFKQTNELQVTGMLSSVSHWRSLYNEDFAVFHDVSSTFTREREVWQRIINNNVPSQTFQLADGSLGDYPLRVISTTAVDSKDHHTIQFCDILAGLSARCSDARIEGGNRELLDAVLGAGLGEIIQGGVQPRPIFPERAPPKLTGPDIVDQMSAIVFGHPPLDAVVPRRRVKRSRPGGRTGRRSP